VEPKYGGVFHIPVSGNNANLNPYSVGGAPINLFNPTMEPLIARDAKPGVNWWEHQRMVPWLAERWEQPAPTTYVFHLRKGVSWHDGQPFTSADVVHTIKFLQDGKGRYLDAGRTLNIASVEATDQFTVKITTLRANPDFLTDDIYNIEMAAKHVADAGKQYETTLVGTGPFVLKDFDTTTGWKVARNPNYWMKASAGSGQGLPYLDGIAGHYMTDRGTMMAAFAAANIDAMNPEDKVQFETVQGFRNDLKYEKFYGTYGYGLLFALDQAPYNDIRVRRAINLVADRQDMVQKAAFGDGVINPPGVFGWKKGWALPQEELLKLPGYNPATKQQDIAEARRLLNEAGYGSGFSAKVGFSGASTNPRPIAEILTSQLKPLGISFTLVPHDRATRAQVERDDAFELYIWGLNGDSRSATYERLHSKSGSNKKGPKDAELDALIDKLQVEFNEAEAQRLYQAIQRRLYDQAYFIGAFERASYTVYQPWVYDMLNNYGANTIPTWHPPIAWMDLDIMPANRKGEKP